LRNWSRRSKWIPETPTRLPLRVQQGTPSLARHLGQLVTLMTSRKVSRHRSHQSGEDSPGRRFGMGMSCLPIEPPGGENTSMQIFKGFGSVGKGQGQPRQNCRSPSACLENLATEAPDLPLSISRPTSHFANGCERSSPHWDSSRSAERLHRGSHDSNFASRA